MTAEVAIANRTAVALAADSAVTMGRRKVWKNTNKLFSLSPTNDIGIMIYGNADFVGFPWETVIKVFRQEHSKVNFTTVSECAEAFMEFLKGTRFRDKYKEIVTISGMLMELLEEVKDGVDISSASNFKHSIPKKLKKLTRRLEEDYEQIDGMIEQSLFNELFEEMVTDLSKDIFERHVPKYLVVQLLDFLRLCIGSTVESDFKTGIVFSGFGKEQLFPQISSYRVDGRLGKFVRCWKYRDRDLNQMSTTAILVPFAQSDMSKLFMEGIAGEHIEYVTNFFSTILDERTKSFVKDHISDLGERKVEVALQRKENAKILDKFQKEFLNYRQETMINPVLEIVDSLPKEEMAAMAEALVEITTLRRKVDSNLESVGGPTDVAIISKGDGFVWIKRKYYFSADLNNDYLLRKQAFRDQCMEARLDNEEEY